MTVPELLQSINREFEAGAEPEFSANLAGFSNRLSTHLILDGTDNFETRYLINDFAESSSNPSCLRNT